MKENLPLIILGAALLVFVLWFWLRRRAVKRAQRRPLARPAAPAGIEPAAPPAAWMPPRYDAAQDAISGPALRAGISIIRLRDDGLLVSWNATNNGSVPVAVQWGAPQVTVEGDLLQLRYTQEGADPFSLPETRTYQPGEILSRSATVTRAAIGREPAGMRVTVTVGYGDAAAHEVACLDQVAYLDWQRVAVSPPRIVPRQ